MTPLDFADPFAVEVAVGAEGVLGHFNRARVLAPADIHVATHLAKIAGEDDQRVVLAAALAVRGPRFGHVRTAIREVRSTVAADVEDTAAVESLDWPDEDDWISAIRSSRLVAIGEAPDDRPLRLIDDSLYLDRYWRDECSVAQDLLERAAHSEARVDTNTLRDGIARLFGTKSSDEQRWAAALALLRRLSVIAGGPGTGKTTTISRIIALLHEQAIANQAAPPLIALAAPTGKAAARMEEAVRRSASELDLSERLRERLLATEGLTIHRLLRRRPDSSSRFRFARDNRLPHDVVILDETSMVSLSLMARLLEAIRSDARVILVGDPEQLASVEAGAVLGDIVGPAIDGPVLGTSMCDALESVTGCRPEESPAAEGSGGGAGGTIGDGTVLLRSNFRFSGALSDLSLAIKRGDADATVDALRSGGTGLTWIDADVVEMSRTGPVNRPSGLSDTQQLADLREACVGWGRRLLEAALAGDAASALGAIAGFRLLCGHRSGPGGVQIWAGLVESWLASDVEGFDVRTDWYPGRPVMVTANDYGLRLFNGDTGATIVRPDGSLGVAFARGGSVVTVSPSRLSSTESVYASTIHKSQGSEFDRAAVVLPPPESPLLTRELLYTAVTRARNNLIVVGREESVRAAVSRPVARASGLTARIWG